MTSSYCFTFTNIFSTFEQTLSSHILWRTQQDDVSMPADLRSQISGEIFGCVYLMRYLTRKILWTQCTNCLTTYMWIKASGKYVTVGSTSCQDEKGTNMTSNKKRVGWVFISGKRTTKLQTATTLDASSMSWEWVRNTPQKVWQACKPRIYARTKLKPT